MCEREERGEVGEGGEEQWGDPDVVEVQVGEGGVEGGEELEGFGAQGGGELGGVAEGEGGEGGGGGARGVEEGVGAVVAAVF